MITIACEETPLIKNQLRDTRLARGTGHFRASGLFSHRDLGAMRGQHGAMPAGRRPGLPPKRPHPPTQGAAHAHRLSFSQYGQTRIQGCVLRACTAAWLGALGVGVRVRRRCARLLARLGSGEKHVFILGGVKIRRSLSGLRPPVGSALAGAPALMRAPARLGWPQRRPALVPGLGKVKRSPSGLRPPVGIRGAGAPALTRAPASLSLGWAI